MQLWGGEGCLGTEENLLLEHDPSNLHFDITDGTVPIPKQGTQPVDKRYRFESLVLKLLFLDQLPPGHFFFFFDKSQAHPLGLHILPLM